MPFPEKLILTVINLFIPFGVCLVPSVLTSEPMLDGTGGPFHSSSLTTTQHQMSPNIQQLHLPAGCATRQEPTGELSTVSYKSSTQLPSYPSFSLLDVFPREMKQVPEKTHSRMLLIVLNSKQPNCLPTV